MDSKYDLQKKENSELFYENCYAGDYMAEWSLLKKKRTLEIIRNLNLPKYGKAVDFGCGNGIFTHIIQQALPDWEVCGIDISHNAIKNAKNRFPKYSFKHASSSHLENNKFDFLFTHHVWEHVYNLEKIWQEAIILMNPNSTMLHILPCGNEGSFEHKICLLRLNGIDKNKGNRFFFEDQGHIRRLNTKQFDQLAKKNGFKKSNEYYSNQYYGSIVWIIESGINFVKAFFDESYAKDNIAKKEIKKYKYWMILLSITCGQCSIFLNSLKRSPKTIKNYIKILFRFPFIIFYPILWLLHKIAQNEWEQKKHLQNGSEMYLYYKRLD